MNEYLCNNSPGLFGFTLNHTIKEIINTSNCIHNDSNYLATDINNNTKLFSD